MPIHVIGEGLTRYPRWGQAGMLALIASILLIGLLTDLPRSSSASAQPGTPTGAGTPTDTSTATEASTETGTPTPTLTHTASPVPTYVASCQAAWHEVTSPNTDHDDNILTGVYSLSTNDIWAVGEASFGGKSSSTLTEHWDGTAWRVVQSPNAGPETFLKSVWAAAPNDVWAVGFSLAVPNRDSFIMHWDGLEWSIVPSPTPPSGVAELYGVSGSSASDIWAVGTATLHWDGSQWTLVAMPGLPTYAVFYGIHALSANDIWAVGVAPDPTSSLTMHWNGTQWSRVASPNAGNGTNILAGIMAIGPNDIWAVGRYFPESGGTTNNTLAMHWNGTSWTIMPTPNVGTSNYLSGVTARASNDVWAVGGGNPVDRSLTLVLHWDGSQWGQVYAPSPGQESSFADVAALPNGELWSVGHVTTSNQLGTPFFTLVELYSSTDFIDVPQGSTFYPYIKCLACRGVVSGYPDGTFRPNNPLTRGQLAKMVSSAAGITDPVAYNQQTFEDVRVSNAFWLWVERLAGQGIIGGYPCGGPGEPCDPNNRPYYRPDMTASRGQLAKIASNAAHFTDPIPAGQQTFTDVIEGSTFYTYTERLLLNRPGVMQGYSCGGPGEPCDPQGRPYFRTNYNVTRGQSAKILSRTFLEGCMASGY